jgi:hypothetical protein
MNNLFSCSLISKCGYNKGLRAFGIDLEDQTCIIHRMLSAIKEMGALKMKSLLPFQSGRLQTLLCWLNFHIYEASTEHST